MYTCASVYTELAQGVLLLVYMDPNPGGNRKALGDFTSTQTTYLVLQQHVMDWFNPTDGAHKTQDGG